MCSGILDLELGGGEGEYRDLGMSQYLNPLFTFRYGIWLPWLVLRSSRPTSRTLVAIMTPKQMIPHLKQPLRLRDPDRHAFTPNPASPFQLQAGHLNQVAVAMPPLSVVDFPAGLREESDCFGDAMAGVRERLVEAAGLPGVATPGALFVVRHGVGAVEGLPVLAG